LILFAVISAFALACVAALLLGRIAAPLGLVDLPNARSLHQAPMPRSGGLAIWAGILTGAVMVIAWTGVPAVLAWIAGAVLLVGIVSLADDRSHVPVGLRLIAQGGAAGLLIAGGLALQAFQLPGIYIELSMGISYFLTLILIVWMTNLYNFMDGMDGLAAGMAVFGFGALGLLGLLGGDVRFATLCWVVAGGAGGFLVWNFPPARIFMGDSGASVLGLLAGTLSLWGDRLGLFPLWAALLAFSPFIVDATVTLARRVVDRKRFWEAHRDHYYQRLAQAEGWGHRRTALWEYALMLLCCAGAVFAAQAGTVVQWLVITLAGFFYIAAIPWVNHKT
jgi:UDP-N-acetylmuramyl pentapeptide phosphotransferase/UDP-N-acetylglucosamine-1-phosphate transferase